MAKLNKEQLKKLYDYGGTLSPKDWANMIDSLDNSVINTDSLPIVKTTYEEVVNLYRKGMLDPNVKYEFDYNYPNFYESVTAFFKNLRIYIYGKDINVEYKVVNNSEEIDYNIYPRSFVAKFKFDSLITNYSMYEGKQDHYVTLSIDRKSNIELIYNILDTYSIDYEIIKSSFDSESNEGELHLFIKNSFVDYLDNYYHIYALNKCISINDNSGNIDIFDEDYTMLAAITDVQYPDGTFHNIFIDRRDTDMSGEYLSLLKYMQLYGAPLDTSISSYHISDLASQSDVDIISFGDISVLNLLTDRLMQDEPIYDILIISTPYGKYLIDKLDTY